MTEIRRVVTDGWAALRDVRLTGTGERQPMPSDPRIGEERLGSGAVGHGRVTFPARLSPGSSRRRWRGDDWGSGRFERFSGGLRPRRSVTRAALALTGLAVASYLFLVWFGEPQGFAGGVVASLIVALGQIGIVVLVVDGFSRRDQEARDRVQAEMRLNASIHGALAIVASSYGVRGPVYSSADQLLTAISLSRRGRLESLTEQLEELLAQAYTSTNGTLTFPWNAQAALKDLAEACGVLGEDVVVIAHNLAGAWGADQSHVVVSDQGDYLPRDVSSLLVLIGRLEHS